MAKKEIVYSIVFDNSSFNRAMSQIQALDQQFKRASQSSGGFMAGGGFGVQAQKNQTRTGNRPATGQQTIGVPQGLTKALQDQKTLMGGFEKEIRSTFQIVNRTVMDAVSVQVAALDQLEKKLDSINQKMSAMGGGLSKMGGAGSTAQGGGGGGGGGGGKGGSGSGGGGTQGGGGAAQGGGGGRGFNYMGMAITGVGVAAQIAKTAPYELNRDRAMYAAAIRTPAMEMLGMTGRGMAFAQAMRENRNEYRARVGSNQDSDSWWANMPVDIRGGTLEKYGRYAGGVVSGVSDFVRGRFGNAAKDIYDTKNAELSGNMENVQDIENYMKADPRRYLGAQRLGEGAFDRARMQSKLRLGNRDKVKFRRDAKTGRVIRGGGIMDVEDNLFENALSLSDLAAGQDSIVATGGLRAAIKRRGLSMLATRGGYGDAGSIIGSLAKMGQDPSRFLHQVSGMRSFGNPKVGFDEQAGNDLAKAIASQVNQGATSVSAEAALRVAMGGMRSIGGSDMYRQEALAQGGAYLGDQVFAGNLDPLQKARNYKHALQAFGGNAAIARYVSENPNAQTMMEQAAAGGKMDSFFQQMGMSEAQYKAGMAQYGNLTFGNNFRGVADYSSSIPEDSPMGKMRKMLEQGGFGMDFGRLAKSKGWQGEELVKHAETAAQLYRLNQIADGSPMDDKTARGAIGRMVARISPEDKTLELAGFKGGPAAQERAVLEGQNKLNKEAANQAAEMSPEMIKNISGMGERLYDLGGKLGMSMKDFDQGLQNTSALLDQLNGKLESAFGLQHQVTAAESKAMLDVLRKLSAPYTGGGKK